MTISFDHPLSVAPMMQRTDRHFRYFMRKITGATLLYSEMLTTGAIIHGDRQRLLGFDASEHPIALQIGGSDPDDLAEAARIGQSMGYDEINLNVGCPSSRVQNARIGACLMGSPDVVARAVEAMNQAVDIEVTVKHRIGIDDLDTYDHMLHFVDTVADAGCRRFTVHARKAWLQGLSPAENRNVPPLRHHEVHELKRQRPHLIIETNGGIQDLDTVEEHLQHVDAVMIGRAAYKNPFLFANADQRIYGRQKPSPTRVDVALSMCDYIDHWVHERGINIHHISRHMIQLFYGQPGARRWRRILTEGAQQPNIDSRLIRRGVDAVRDARNAA